MASKITACVMTHGHLDIEWYQPMRSFAFWTQDALDRLLEQCEQDETTPPYALDGQVFPLEEYLRMRPENRERVLRLIQSGKLRIGPFFTQFDEWLPSPEGMVRNCLVGAQAAARLGQEVMKVGYLPDNFGHPLQLPQILNGFGIDSLLFMRGMPWVREDYPDEFEWRGLDGSSLYTVHFRDGYSRIYGKNIQNFALDFVPQFRCAPYAEDYISYEHYMEMTTIDDPERHAYEMVEYVRKIERHFPSGVVPVMLGCDHSPPHIGVQRAVACANASQDEIEFVVTEPEAYLRRARSGSRETLDWELLGTRFQYVLLGALSTRSYLKRANFASEALLERYAEPLCAVAQRLGARHEVELLDDAWRLLLINHAHDSIHGSSVDPVHDQMVSRYHDVKQVGTALSHRAMAALAARMPHTWSNDAHGILCYRPFLSEGVHSAEVWLPSTPESLFFSDVSGNPLHGQRLARPAPEPNERGNPSHLYYPTERLDRYLVQLPGGQNAFSLVVAKPGVPKSQNLLRTGDGFIENEHLIVRARGAVIDVQDKRDGYTYHALNLIEEQAEAGDYWDTSPTWQPSETVLSTRFSADVRILESGPVRAVMEIKTVLNVPLRLEKGLRSQERVDIPVCFEIALCAGVDRVDVALELDNRAMDHKLSLVFAPGIAGTILSQNAFAAFERPDVEHNPDRQCMQPPTRLFPFREWLAIRGKNCAMAIACRGLYDYEPLTDPVNKETAARLTLLRSVGNMSRVDMKSREGEAAWSVPSYSAQCLGPQRFEFSYLPFDPGEESAFLGSIEAYLYPPLAHAVRDPAQGDAFNPNVSMPHWHEGNVRFSAFKRAEDGDGYILRLYENLGQATRLRIAVPSFEEASLCTLAEAVIDPLVIKDGELQVDVAPYQIRTIRLKG